MKKKICSLLMIAMLFSLFVGTAMAVDDAEGLEYQLILSVTDQSGTAKTTFAVGEEIRVTVSIKSVGANRALVYGLQGQLLFDRYVMLPLKTTSKDGLHVAVEEGKGTFVYLDMSGQGTSDAILSELATFSFQGNNDGICSLSVDDLILTNQDASARYVDDSASIDITVGTGIRDATKDALNSDILAAQEELDQCRVTDQSNPSIYYPDVWITTKTRDAFQAEINAAKAVLANDAPTKLEIEAAILRLQEAKQLFYEAQIVGSRRWSSMVTVSAVAGDHGEIHPDYVTQRCRKNTSCTVVSIPDEGYETEYVYVNETKFLGTEVFTIPRVENDILVKVTFAQKLRFDDVSREDWYYAAVQYVYSHQLFQGTDDKTFSPNASMSRAMLATVLYRMADAPSVSTDEATFTDVKKGQWYSDAVSWAATNGIVKGYGNEQFAPDAPITREQIAVMLYRYVDHMGKKTDASGTLDQYLDYQMISEFAQKEMDWATGMGLMKGTPEQKLEPQGVATRAQVATILMRWMEEGA